jgi:hypothetical protein
MVYHVRAATPTGICGPLSALRRVLAGDRDTHRLSRSTAPAAAGGHRRVEFPDLAAPKQEEGGPTIPGTAACPTKPTCSVSRHGDHRSGPHRGSGGPEQTLAQAVAARPTLDYDRQYGTRRAGRRRCSSGGYQDLSQSAAGGSGARTPDRRASGDGCGVWAASCGVRRGAAGRPPVAPRPQRPRPWPMIQHLGVGVTRRGLAVAHADACQGRLRQRSPTMRAGR